MLNIRLTFLLYFSRSGSTMLANQIAKLMPDVLVFPELDFVGDLFAYGDEYVRSLSAEKLFQLLSKDEKLVDIGFSESIWRELVVKCEGEGVIFLLTEITNLYARQSGQGQPQVVLFQRGTLLSVAQDILEIYPSARFIHIFRDPRAAISSIVRVRSASFVKFDRQRMGRSDAIGLGKNWIKYTGRVNGLENSHPDNVMQVRYEDLCAHKESHLQEISEFLKVDYSTVEEGAHGLIVGDDEGELHKYIDKPPMLERLNAWREELPMWQGYLVEYVLGDRLITTGYAPYFSTNVSTSQHLAYLARGLFEYYYESLMSLLRRLLFFLKSPRRAIRRLRRKFAN